MRLPQRRAQWRIDRPPGSCYDAGMNMKKSFDAKYGGIIHELAAEWDASVTYEYGGGDCMGVLLGWTNPYRVGALIGIGLEDEGFDINLSLEGQFVQLGRMKSWDTPASKFRMRLKETKGTLDGYTQPPLGRLV